MKMNVETNKIKLKDGGVVSIHQLSEKYTLDQYNYLKDSILSKGTDEVLVYNKKNKIHENKTIFRNYLCTGNTPDFDKDVEKSFMFMGQRLKNSPAQDLKNLIPEGHKYNQEVLNYYKDGNSYIEPHSDCSAKMEDDYTIAILTLSPEGGNRIFRLESRTSGDCIDIKTEHGQILILDKEANESYRHSVPKDKSKESRISITYRQIKEIK